MPPGTGGKHAHRYSASSGGPHRRAYQRRWRQRLEAPREAVFPEGCHSRDSDAAPTRAGGRSSDEPRILEAEGAWTPRCAGANRPPDPEGSSRPGTGKRSRQTNFTHKGWFASGIFTGLGSGGARSEMRREYSRRSGSSASSRRRCSVVVDIFWDEVRQ